MYAFIICAVQCKNQEKIPESFASVVEKIVHSDCTYGFVIDVTLGYDPIVLEDVKVLTVLVIQDSVNVIDHQSFSDPYNTVSV